MFIGQYLNMLRDRECYKFMVFLWELWKSRCTLRGKFMAYSYT